MTSSTIIINNHMPTYTFKNISTGKVWEETISISARDEMVKDPNIQQIIDEAPAMSYKGTRTKPDSGFRDVLKRIKSKHRGSNINTF
jgi:hypothetical protein